MGLKISDLTQDTTLAEGTLFEVSNAGYSRSISAIDVLKYSILDQIRGFSISNNVSDANNDIDITVGMCLDSTREELIYNMTGSTLIKRLDANWSVGTNAGGLDTGSKATSTVYYIYAIKKDADGSIDYLFSVNATTPTMPAGYTYKRLIGTCITDVSGNILSGTWNRINGNQISFVFSTPVASLAITTSANNTRNTLALTVPSGNICEVFFNTHFNTQTGSANYGIVLSPYAADIAPLKSNANLGSDQNNDGRTGALVVTTDTSGNITYRIDQGGGVSIAVYLTLTRYIQTL